MNDRAKSSAVSGTAFGTNWSVGRGLSEGFDGQKRPGPDAPGLISSLFEFYLSGINSLIRALNSGYIVAGPPWVASRGNA